jgi:GT2 family glycosyltransferase
MPFSIVIPTYGIKGIYLTEILIKSISKFYNPNMDEIIISDDSSNYDTIQGFNFLKDRFNKIFNIKIIFNPYLRSFSKTVNMGMKVANPSNDILLLNNDMEARTSFEPFLNFMDNHDSQKIGIMGAKLLFPDLRIQHVGIVRIPFLHYFMHRFKFRHYSYGPANSPEKYIAVTGACLYINRKLIDKIGYLDEGYRFSYEDVDYCVNAQLNGFEVWYIPDVELLHFESISRKRVKNFDQENNMMFWAKWSKQFPILDKNIVTEEKIIAGGMILSTLRLLLL